jgi:hypothetical protein
MAYELDYNDSLRILDVEFHGSVSGPELHEATSRAIELLKIHGILDVLIDLTNMELPPPISDIYAMPAEQYREENLSHCVRIALIQPQSLTGKEAAQFYENACVNRGWVVKSFLDRDEAVKWLMDIGGQSKNTKELDTRANRNKT